MDGEVETFHESTPGVETEMEEEVVFRERSTQVERPSPSLITANDMDVIIKGWEEKFEHLAQCLRDIQSASEKANSTIYDVEREGRAREDRQERRIGEMHTGLTRFLERCYPAHLTAPRSAEAPTESTPFTPTGAPSRLRHDLHFESPVNQDRQADSARNRDHYDAREATRTSMDTRNIDPRSIHPHDTYLRNRDHDANNDIDPHNIDPRNTRPRNTDPRNHDARDCRDHRSHERPTHENDRGDGSDAQRNSYHSNMSHSMSHSSSSPKVPTFDGTVSAQFRPCIIQFETIARHQGWTPGERVVRLVASLTGSAANLLIGMTMGQLDDYTFLVARLSRRYDPPEREEAHRAELRTRTRRRNETADEFAENLKNLAQRAYTSADQNMLDNLVVERFREGHGNEELKKHLCLYPSTGLQDLIGACVRFKTHVEIGARAHKSNEGLYTVQNNNNTELTLEEVTRAARRLGFTLRPWIDRQQNNRGFNNAGPNRNQNGSEPQQGSRFNQNRNSG